MTSFIPTSEYEIFEKIWSFESAESGENYCCFPFSQSLKQIIYPVVIPSTCQASISGDASWPKKSSAEVRRLFESCDPSLNTPNYCTYFVTPGIWFLGYELPGTEKPRVRGRARKASCS